jgi:hypothetical protein
MVSARQYTVVTILLLLLCSFTVPKRDGRHMLYKMYSRYHGHWQRSLKFIQQTDRYNNDTLTGSETWYETIVYPRSFRIDFGMPSKGNCVLFRNDSAYIFRNSTLAKSRVDSNELLFILGGMYHAPDFAQVKARFLAMHYDLSKGFYTTWHGTTIFVIGAAADGEEVNQLWVDTRHYHILRSLRYTDGIKEEIVMEGHQRLGRRKWSETKVAFYRDGHLLQQETYSHLIANDYIDPVIFSPATPWLWHWANQQGSQ